jgi:hypothetical protein
MVGNPVTIRSDAIVMVIAPFSLHAAEPCGPVDAMEGVGNAGEQVGIGAETLPQPIKQSESKDSSFCMARTISQP